MRRLLFIIVVASLALSCVDPVNLSLPVPELPLILEGSVKDNPAPDTIRLTRAYPADGKTYPRVGISGAKMWITDNTGAVDTLVDVTKGVYVTNMLQGVVGRTYTLHGRYPNKNPEITFSSTPEQMLPAGTIDSVYYELTSSTNAETGLPEDGLNVFVNATVDASSNRRLRWKFNGTYSYQSDPSLIQIPVAGCLGPGCPTTPLPCSLDCSCCFCWASEREALPLVTSPAFLGGTTVKRVFVKYIPVNGFTFNEKYRVEVAQMELSKPVFDFYSGIRKQMENATSLFQPPFFELDGNVSVVSGTIRIIGIFSAAAEVNLVKYIHRDDLPFNVERTVLAGDCRAIIDHSTSIEPPFWN